MDTKFIVLSLLRQAEAAGVSGEVTHAVRLDKALNDQAGEGYLLCFGDTLCLAERPLGQSNYRCLVAPLERAEALRLEKGGSSSFVELEINGVRARCVWSWSENRDADELLARLKLPDGQASPATSENGDDRQREDAGVLFTAGLMYAAEYSRQLSPDQERLIRELAPPGKLNAGLDYYHANELTGFVAAARAVFSEKQLVSLLANQLELLMIDGDFRRDEQEGMRRLGQLLGVSGDRLDQILETILCKNQSPVLFA